MPREKKTKTEVEEKKAEPKSGFAVFDSNGLKVREVSTFSEAEEIAKIFSGTVKEM